MKLFTKSTLKAGQKREYGMMEAASNDDYLIKIQHKYWTRSKKTEDEVIFVPKQPGKKKHMTLTNLYNGTVSILNTKNMPKRKHEYSTSFRQYSQELDELSQNCKRSTPTMMQTPELGSPKDVWSLLCSKDELIKRHWNKNDHPLIQLPQMRFLVTDWLMEVCADRKLHRETFHLAVEYFDRFMNHTRGIQPPQLQLIGTAALSIACKFEEIYPPKLAELVEYSDGGCTADQVVSMECIILAKLGWNFTPITTVHWLGCFLQLLSKMNENSPASIRKKDFKMVNLPSLNSSDDEFSSFLSLIDGVTNALDTSVNDSFLIDPNRSYDGHVIVNDSICVPKLMRDEFVQLARIIDLLLVDYNFLSRRYGELAAAVLFCSYEPYEAIEEITGFKRDSLSELIRVVQFYVDYCEEKSIIFENSFIEEINNDDRHNIQTYTPGNKKILDEIDKRRITKMRELNEIHKEIKKQRDEAVVLKDVNS